MLRRTRHENLILFMGACMEPPTLAILCSYVSFFVFDVDEYHFLFLLLDFNITFIYWHVLPQFKYLFKVNNKNAKTMLTNFLLVSFLLTLNKYLPT